MNNYCILDGRTLVPVDMMTWARWFQNAERHVAQDTIGDVHVSTVFLGADHSYGKGAPLYFETMVFGGPLNEECERYSSWEEAEAGHKATVERVKSTVDYVD